MRKRCADCKKYKPVTEFPRNKNCKDGFHSYCKVCNNARSREQLVNDSMGAVATITSSTGMGSARTT